MNCITFLGGTEIVNYFCNGNLILHYDSVREFDSPNRSNSPFELLTSTLEMEPYLNIAGGCVFSQLFDEREERQYLRLCGKFK